MNIFQLLEYNEFSSVLTVCSGSYLPSHLVKGRLKRLLTLFFTSLFFPTFPRALLQHIFTWGALRTIPRAILLRNPLYKTGILNRPGSPTGPMNNLEWAIKGPTPQST